MVKKKPEPNQDLELQVQKLQEAYQRARADYTNLENRVKANQEQFASLVSATILTKVIGIIDHLELAARHLNDQGINMILEQMKRLLEEEGVTPLETVGQTFDPLRMECSDKVDGPADQVVTELSKGYMLGKHLLRPAKVTVGSGDSKQELSNN